MTLFTQSMLAFLADNYEDMAELDALPHRLGHTVDLQLSGRLRDLYSSDKWEFGAKHAMFHHRSWKRHRSTQYRPVS